MLLLIYPGNCDDSGNFCVPAKTALLRTKPPGGQYPLPKPNSKSQPTYKPVPLGSTGLTVELIYVSNDGEKAALCHWLFKNSNNAQKEVWYNFNAHNDLWISSWVYADLDPRSKKYGDGCKIQSDCDKDNDGIYIP